MLALSAAKWEGMDSGALAMATPTYRSINQTATLLGIDLEAVHCHPDRRVSGFFRHFTFSSALVAFALLWSGAYWVTKHDAELVVIVPKAFGQRSLTLLAAAWDSLFLPACALAVRKSYSFPLDGSILPFHRKYFHMWIPDVMICGVVSIG